MYLVDWKTVQKPHEKEQGRKRRRIEDCEVNDDGKFLYIPGSGECSCRETGRYQGLGNVHQELRRW
jgi:hypothetical protein